MASIIVPRVWRVLKNFRPINVVVMLGVLTDLPTVVLRGVNIITKFSVEVKLLVSVVYPAQDSAASFVVVNVAFIRPNAATLLAAIIVVSSSKVVATNLPNTVLVTLMLLLINLLQAS